MCPPFLPDECGQQGEGIYARRIRGGVGCGYMGCGAISLLKLRGFRAVAVDIREACLADAKKYGAYETLLVEEAMQKYSTANGFSGFEAVMEWGETAESLDTAIALTKECGQLYAGAYHTGGNRLVDMQQLGMKAIEQLNTHPREGELSHRGARIATELLAEDMWDCKGLPVKIYPMSKFDQAHAEIKSKYGSYMKALIDMTKVDGEPVIV